MLLLPSCAAGSARMSGAQLKPTLLIALGALAALTLCAR